MGQEKISTSEGTVEASGDALVIADAIYAGLSEIAKAIKSMNEDIGSDYGEPEVAETYLDGTRV